MSSTGIEEVALTMVSGLGATGTRRLIDIVGSAKELFSLPLKELQQLFGTHRNIANSIFNKSTFARAEEEMRFCEKHGVEPLFMTDERYPRRLNRAECEDCPTLVYTAGGCDLNHEKTVGIVGTRRATEYGRDQAEKIVADLQAAGIVVVSGLAYGIDTVAHRSAVDRDIPTVAVLGHGLDRIYPPENRTLAHQIVAHRGALMTEYTSGTAINARYFPARNRIIAAMSDAVIVVEASEKGGALITANIATSYQREVFALPGRLDDPLSAGCNNLIANNKASLYRSAEELCQTLNWALGKSATGKQTQLFVELDPDEEAVMTILRSRGQLPIDELSTLTPLSFAKLTAVLFALELKNSVRCLPGKVYKAL
ncbi:MAG: DNA-processing protein DprA [Bacteroidales bacterium]|nr:DNA-processing protein DprA [Bacteroidales bacterium]